MALYNLYAGMVDDFDALKYRCTRDFQSQHDAEIIAHELALDIYSSHEGEHGIKSWEECAIDLQGGNIIPFRTEAELDDYYYAVVEKHIRYYAILASEDPNKPIQIKYPDLYNNSKI